MEKKVLLIADDDEMNRKIISRFLKGTYEILEASDGQIAWDMLEAKHIDALLLDIIMPHMDGLEVLERMRKDKKYVEILNSNSNKDNFRLVAEITSKIDSEARKLNDIFTIGN